MAVEYQCDEHSYDDKTGKKTTTRVKDTVEFVGFKDLAILGRYPDAAAALAARTYL